jgi:hypothetical protein
MYRLSCTVRRTLIVVLACLVATVSNGGDQVRSIKIPDSRVTFEGKDKLTEVPEDGFQPKRKNGPIIEYKEYENADDAEIGLVVYVSRYRKPVKVDLSSMMMTLCATYQTYEEEELEEAKVLEEETTTFGENPAIRSLVRVKSVDGDFFMDTLLIADGNTETSVTVTYLDEPAAKEQATKLIRSVRLAGSPAGEMKPIKWEE